MVFMMWIAFVCTAVVVRKEEDVRTDSTSMEPSEIKDASLQQLESESESSSKLDSLSDSEVESESDMIGRCTNFCYTCNNEDKTRIVVHRASGPHIRAKIAAAGAAGGAVLGATMGGPAAPLLAPFGAFVGGSAGIVYPGFVEKVIPGIFDGVGFAEGCYEIEFRRKGPTMALSLQALRFVSEGSDKEKAASCVTFMKSEEASGTREGIDWNGDARKCLSHKFLCGPEGVDTVEGHDFLGDLQCFTEQEKGDGELKCCCADGSNNGFLNSALAPLRGLDTQEECKEYAEDVKSGKPNVGSAPPDWIPNVGTDVKSGRCCAHLRECESSDFPNERDYCETA